MLPSQLFKERIITCFIDDAFGVANRDFLNIDMITWECDYPHSDSTWPNSPEALQKYVDGVSDEEINKMTHLNAMRNFQFDPFSVRPRESCTVGALRAETADVDTSTVSRGSGGPKPVDGVLDLGDIGERFAKLGDEKIKK